jgi:hypothetical protein
MSSLSQHWLYIRCISLFLAFLLFSIHNSANAQDWTWVKKVGIGGQYDIADIIKSVTDKDGNTYVVGYYYQKIVLGDKLYEGPNFLYDNFFVAKFDNRGNVIWSSVFNGAPYTDDVSIHNIAIDKNGRVYLTGSFTKTVSFSGTVSLSMPPSNGPFDYTTAEFLCVYHSDGTPAWAKFGTATVCQEGILSTISEFHDGFSTQSQWKNHNNNINDDSLYYYNADGQYLKKEKNIWPDYGNDVCSQIIGKDSWIAGIDGYDFRISRYVHDNNQLDETATIPNMPSLTDFKIHKDAVFFLGCFDAYGSGILQFGDITLTSSDYAASYHVEGFLVKYDVLTKKFVWGKTIRKMNCGFNKSLVVSATDVLYVSSEEVGTGGKNYIRAYSIEGDSLWTRTSQAYIHDNNALGTDQFGNVYVTGGAHNGLSSKANFGSLSFTYDYTVGFLAKIALPYPTPVAPADVTGSGISTSAVKLQWTDGNDEVGYRIQYKATDETAFQELGTVASNSTYFIASNLMCHKQYTFRIQALGEGNSSAYSSEVTVKPLSLAKPVISSSASHACIGQQVIISASQGFDGYIWNNNETTQSVTVTTTGEYAVKVKDNANCESAFSDKIKIMFYAYPDTTATIVNNSILLQSNAEQYQWYRNNVPVPGETQNNITPTETGFYKAEASYKGCTSFSRDIPFTVTGLEETWQANIDMYPVPASGTLTIRFMNDQQNAKGVIRLMDIKGKRLFECNKGNDLKTVVMDIQDIPAGVYILHIGLGKYVGYRRVIIY